MLRDQQHLCLNSALNVKAVVAAFNQEKALRMDFFEALITTVIHGYYWKCFYTQYFSITEICFYELQNAVFYFWMKL